MEFLKGEIEHIPLPDNSVDVIISNCVINLSADKSAVLREAFRVLKPGGRFAVSDVITRGEIAPQIRESVLLWVGCVAGALEENEYREKLSAAGFTQIDIEPTRIYRMADAREFLAQKGIDVDALAPQVDGKFMSAFVRAIKPTADAPRRVAARRRVVTEPRIFNSSIEENHNGWPLQRVVSMYREFCALDHGRSDLESERQTEFRCVQRWKPSVRDSAAGGDRNAGIGPLASQWLAQQELG